MIDKDLDSILANIDKESDHEKARSKAVEEDTSSRTSPASEKSYRDRIASLKVTPSLQTFKKGLLEKLKIHLECCNSFRAMNVNLENEPEVEQVLNKYKYTFIRSIENVERICNDYFMSLDIRTLEKKARKEYNLFFEGYEEKNKLDFIILCEMFLELREFNSFVRKEWRELAKSVGVINLVPGGKQLFQSLNAIIEQALVLCNETAEFVFFLSQIVGIPENRQDLLKSEIYRIAEYHEEMKYDYDSILDVGKEKTAELSVDSALEIFPEIKSEAKINDDVQPIPSLSTDELVEAEVKSEKEVKAEIVIPFTLRGTRSWNTKEPYLIRINAGRLDKEKDELLDSFYFIQNPIDEKLLEGEIKRHLLAFLRNRSLNIVEPYGEFLFKSIFLKMQEIVAFFNAEKNMTLFLYHLGPYTAYQILYDWFVSENVGFCFKYTAANKVVRFLPWEFVKATVLEWFEHNVNVFELPFDSIQEYENIRKMVSRKYFAAVDESYKKLDDLIAKNGFAKDIKFDKQAVFKSRWKEWFGGSNIFVYNRFLEKTIFKQSE